MGCVIGNKDRISTQDSNRILSKGALRKPWPAPLYPKSNFVISIILDFNKKGMKIKKYGMCLVMIGILVEFYISHNVHEDNKI